VLVCKLQVSLISLRCFPDVGAVHVVCRETHDFIARSLLIIIAEMQLILRNIFT
jgi:hypothetical protein